MKHHASTDGVSAADIERAMDKIAREIAAVPDGAKYLPLYVRLEQELATIRAAEDALSRAMARLATITR